MSHMRVVANEASIEVAKAKEFLYFLDRLWLWPFLDCLEFDWVHAEFTFRDDKA
jgi:hypothetical protein